MTDNEIKKALENKVNLFCKSCKHKNQNCDGCVCDVAKLALDLINRPQAEVERLNAEINLLKAKISVYEGWGSPQEKIKAEAYKEFAERLKECAFTVNQFEEVLYKEDIDNLLKEMVGDK